MASNIALNLVGSLFGNTDGGPDGAMELDLPVSFFSLPELLRNSTGGLTLAQSIAFARNLAELLDTELAVANVPLHLNLDELWVEPASLALERRNQHFDFREGPKPRIRYAAPEVIAGEDPTLPSYTFSVAALTFEVLTGVSPTYFFMTSGWTGRTSYEELVAMDGLSQGMQMHLRGKFFLQREHPPEIELMRTKMVLVGKNSQRRALQQKFETYTVSITDVFTRALLNNPQQRFADPHSFVAALAEVCQGRLYDPVLDYYQQPPQLPAQVEPVTSGAALTGQISPDGSRGKTLGRTGHPFNGGGKYRVRR